MICGLSGTFNFRSVPYVDLANNEYKLSGDVPLKTVRCISTFKFKGRDEGDMTLADLLGGWTEEKDVGVSWTVGYHEIGGQDGGYPDLVELSFPLEYTLLDPGRRSVRVLAAVHQGSPKKLFCLSAVNPICGNQKVVAPIVMTVDGNEYDGSMTVGLATSSGRKLDAPDVEQEACPMGGLWGIWSADPQITGTCTLGALGGGLTATGTAFGGVGGAEMALASSKMHSGVTTAHASSPCQGTPGASCSNPTWTCQPIPQQTTQATESSTSATSSQATEPSTSSQATEPSTSATSPRTTKATELIRGQKKVSAEAEYYMLDQQGH
ncbi:hypothetical protein THAOC_31382 [Thalassiosira oceanica]|uniref:Uncharacterized protein n=1 Tax=Thalassiosira oceanica TaxID=159749 RepID=K0RBV6_THAOC|nr:hypothetical protein THAOC_31382 [Thalassiosira oceanica]|eukprot:EJK49709.1 hypothetical protein THAOC_31382 [Thalassiosira oceanica]